MNKEFYSRLTQKSLAKEPLSKEIFIQILTSEDIELLPLLNAAFDVRKEYFGNKVKIHIINNVQNGYCSQDCRYCAQSKDANSKINEYPMKTDKEIIAEAKNAYENGAYRYCMVFSGKQLSKKRAEHLSGLIRQIKSEYPI